MTETKGKEETKGRKQEGRKKGRKEIKKEGKKERKKGTRSNNSAAATDGLWPAEEETLCYRIRVFDRANYYLRFTIYARLFTIFDLVNISMIYDFRLIYDS